MRRITFYVMGASAVAGVVLACSFVYEGKWGSFGSGNGQFDTPEGIAVAPNGNVYVVDSENSRVQYFTATGSYLGKWGSWGTGNGQFYQPTGVAVAPNGNVYVVETGNRVQYFTATGSFLGKWGSYGTGSGEFTWPWDVGVASNGNVFVVDHGNHRVQYFTPTGSFLGKWGYGLLDLPEGIGIATNGEVYVADGYRYDNHRVSVFSGTGVFLRHIGAAVLINPRDVAITNLVFVSDTRSSRVTYFEPNGRRLGWFGGGGSGNGKFEAPGGLATSSGGRIYVVDTGNNRVQYFRAANPAVSPTSLGRVKALFR